VYISKRKTTSIYVNPDIWKDFKKKCSVTGQSTCHVLEAFMYAFAKALPDMPITTLPKVEVNLTVNRVVQRVHRVEKEWKGEKSRKIWRLDSEGRPLDWVTAYPDPRDYLYEAEV